VINIIFMKLTKANLENLNVIDIFLSPCVFLLLKSINDLMKITQAKDVFTCDYIIGVKFCIKDLYKMHSDINNSL
jgi:hypothetical protein